MIVTRRRFLGAAMIAPPVVTAYTVEGDRPELVTLIHLDGRATRYRAMMPSHPGRWPVILFSHGANSSSALYDRLWRVWAAHGYAVIGPDHIDSGPVATQERPPTTGLWQSRLDDIVLPLRLPQAFNGLAADRRGRLDWTNVAAAGHSFGAVVAQRIAGASLIDPASHLVSDVREPIVQACLAFSPPGPRPDFIPVDAWRTVHVPCLLQTGDADILPGFVDDWHARLTGFAGAPDRWTLVGHKVDHYFGGLICRLATDAGAQSAALDEAASLSSLMLDTYLKRRPGAHLKLISRAHRGDDGIAIFAGGDTLYAPSPGIDRFGQRRTLISAAVTIPFWGRLAQAASPLTAKEPPLFAPSDTVLIRGANRPGPFIMVKPEHGLDANALATAQAFSDGLGGSALLVSVGGRLAYEHYASGFNAQTPLKTYSMAKSVMAIAFGLAAALRVVALTDPVGCHVDELSDDPRGRITLRQLLQMRSGLKLESLARHDSKAIELVVGHHVTDIALATPLVGIPGEQFEYNNVNSFLVGLALDRALQKAGQGRYIEFFARALWQPLGQADATLEVEAVPAGEPRFFAGLDACGRDWLRIGSLFVDRQHLVPPGWIKAMMTPSANPSYGLQMWIGQPWTPERRYGPSTPSTVPCKLPYLADDIVFYDGAGGQRVYMVPSKRLVIVRTGTANAAWEDSTLPNAIIKGLA